MKLGISSAILQQLQEEVRRSSPEEICGILLGTGHVVQSIVKAKNVATDPVRHFEIDPTILIAAERSIRDGGPEILGYYHSHPSGAVEPSQTDAKSVTIDGRIWLILNGQAAAAWQTVEGGELYGCFEPIALDCLSAKGQTAAD